MPSVFKYNLIQADFPFIAEDYGSITDTTGPDTVDFGEGLPVQSVPDYSTDLYYPLDANGQLLQNPGSYDETGQTFDSTGLTEDQAFDPAYLPYLNYGYIYETQDQYPGGGLTVEGLTGEAKTTKDYTPPLDLYIILAGEVLKKLVKVWVGTGQLFEIREDGGIRLIRQTDSSGTLRFDESTVGATEKVSFNPPENNQLYSISGSSVEKFVAQTPEDTILFTTGGVGLTKQEWNYGYYGDDNDPGTSGIITLDAGSVPTGVVFSADWVGSGSLFGFGEKDESVTWSYNKSSVGFGTEDWGYVYEQAAPINWGFITDPVGGTDQNWGLITETDLVKRPFGTIFFDQTTEGETRLLYLYEVTGAGTSGGITISGRPLVHPEVDYTPHYGIDKNIGIGTTGIQISGEIEDPIRTFSHVGLGTLFTTQGAAESITWDPPVGTVLYDFSGTCLEALSAQTPERTVNVVISGVGTDEKFTAREVGVASTITLTGTLVEKQTDDYVGSGIATISGAAETRQIGVFGYYGDDRDPGTSGIITVFGELNHPDIDYTPHYGIDQNIGIGTTGILFSIGPAGFDIAGNPIGGRYYSPIYPGNAGGVEGDGSPGIGTFRLNDDQGLTITRALLPYFGRGTINVTGIVSEAFGNQVDDDVNVILYNISGDAIERPVQVYGYYGDDRDPGTSGIITLSTQTTETLEKVAYDYVGSGNANFSGAASDVKLVTAYEASGTLFVQGGSAEATTADPADETVLYTFSGNALESYNRAPVIGSGTLTISGAASDIKTTVDEVGSGTLEFSDRAIARVRYIPSIFGSVLFKVGTNLDITCDSDIFECDYFSDALHSLTKDLTDENETASLTVSGSAGTREVDLFQDYTTTGNLTFSSSATERFAFTPETSGTFSIAGIAEESYSRANFSGSGSFSTLNGAAEKFRFNPVGGTILYDIGGSSTTRIEKEYTAVGLGFATFSGSAETRIERELRVSNTVLFRVSGELNHPNIQYIPHYRGGGTITILGSGDESIARTHKGTGGLFGLASGLEAYTRTPYIGVGTIYIGKFDPNGEAAQGAGGLEALADGGLSGGETEKRNFEPPRTFVSII